MASSLSVADFILQHNLADIKINTVKATINYVTIHHTVLGHWVYDIENTEAPVLDEVWHQQLPRCEVMLTAWQ